MPEMDVPVSKSTWSDFIRVDPLTYTGIKLTILCNNASEAYLENGGEPSTQKSRIVEKIIHFRNKVKFKKLKYSPIFRASFDEQETNVDILVKTQIYIIIVPLFYLTSRFTNASFKKSRGVFIQM